jgi:hypothetical protein
MVFFDLVRAREDNDARWIVLFKVLLLKIMSEHSESGHICGLPLSDTGSLLLGRA